MHRHSVAPLELLSRDEHANGGYHSRLSSTAPLELTDFTMYVALLKYS